MLTMDGRATPAYRGRFAPSPTGDLHAGSLLAALGSWLMARDARGRWDIRIEDVDAAREVPGAADRQLNALAAFGLLPDGPVLRQRTREHLYAAALDRLVAAGRAFECWCSRGDLAESGGIHHRCVASPRARRVPAVRLRVEAGPVVAFDDAVQGRFEQDVYTDVGDFVLRRADGFWAYQLAVVVDDAEQGITDIVRGADLLDSTPRQILLQRALGLPTPRHAHLPLLRDAAGTKLSKSLGSMPVDPAEPLPALRRAWSQLGQDPGAGANALSPRAWLDAAVQAFEPERIPRVLPCAMPD
jgi:glutamyl-Q tRNA(Asp) synthetase